jgi:hypothetical protein
LLTLDRKGFGRMANLALNLPLDIPWKLVAASPDMMDTRFCNTLFPPPWRTSLAISVFEPKLEDLPEELCEQRITFVKVSATITGYQPSPEEVKEGAASLPDADIAELLDEYFACYGALLTVAVFPRPSIIDHHGDPDIARFPRIVDFEPKLRDFYQAATDSGEVLTASQSGVDTTKSFLHTDATETGWKLGSKVSAPIAEGVTGELSGEVSRKRTETDQDQWTVATEASRERRERQATTTQLSQMYNLLTGYHTGTNRASFLLLPRPHILQPTDHRTFIQGLRIIEGVQDFFLITSRPVDMDRMCMEVFLETGHFPEDVEIEEPEEEYAEDDEDFRVTAHASGSRTWRNECKDLESLPSSTHTIAGGWVVDRRSNRRDGRRGDPGHPGVIQIANNSNGQANDTVEDDHNYQAISDTSVRVSGEICGEEWAWDPDAADFDRTYRILIRSEQPRPSDEGPVVTTPFLVIRRGLCACVDFSGPCPQVFEPPEGPLPPVPPWIVDERVLRVAPALASREARRHSRTPAMKELLRKIQFAMADSWRSATRRPPDQGGLLLTDYFKERVAPRLPPERLRRRLADVEGLPDEAVRALGKETTVGEALAMPLDRLVSRTGLAAATALAVRRRLLGLRPAEEDGTAPSP